MHFSSLPETIPTILSAKQAIELHGRANIKFLDGSWHLNKDRKAVEEFTKERIEGARFFDIDEASDKNSKLPHMLPHESAFAEYCSSLGLCSDDHVIVYSAHSAFSAPRVWWMFKVFGHPQVSIIDGGLEAWKLEGGEIDSGIPEHVTPGMFTAAFNNKLVADWEDVLSVVQSGSCQIVDARSTARFKAQVDEPRPGLPRGHIPGSLNVPFTSILKEEDVTFFKPKEEIRKAFEEAGLIQGAKVITSCGSGVSAAVLTLGLNLLGKDLEAAPIYDGSWTEWASKNDLPRVPN